MSLQQSNDLSAEEPVPIVIHPPFSGGTDEERALAEQAAAHTLSIAVPAPIVSTRVDEQIAPRRGVVEAAVTATKRARSLDALRGLFLLSMTLGFTLPNEHLPLWMYHRQLPFGAETPVDVAGISWRDLAYASFLFTMAAALPLTISRKLNDGETEIGIVWGAMRRWWMLMVYAFLIASSNTFFLGYTQLGRVLAVVGFGIMAMLYTRRRKDWSAETFRIIRRAGWAAAFLFLLLSPLTYGSTFQFARNDDIITGLAFASLAGSVIWYFTRNNINARLAILATAVALYLGAKSDSWLNDWWWNAGADWIFTPSWFSLLTVVIPGTIAGDIVLRWMRSARDTGAAEAATWPRPRMIALAVLTFAFTPIVVVGMYNRWVQGTTQCCIGLSVGGLFLTMRPVSSTEKMLRSLFVWAAMWLMLGLFLEPFEGGIKKEPETLTYFFTVTGTTSMLLVSLTSVIDGLKQSKPARLLVDVGTNPLLCYVLFTVLLNSVIELAPPLREFMLGSPLPIMIRCLAEVVLVAVITRYLSRRQIYWRT
jgi:hypothetical protein